MCFVPSISVQKALQNQQLAGLFCPLPSNRIRSKPRHSGGIFGGIFIFSNLDA